MESDNIKLLHLAKIENLELKANNTKDLLDSITSLFSKNNLAIENAINIIFDSHIYGLVLSKYVIESLVSKLEDKYGMTINMAELLAEAQKSLAEDWPEIKKDIFDETSAEKQINEIFKDKK